MIRETFGVGWAWVSVAGRGVATAGALLTEFSRVAGVGEIFGVPRVSLALATGFLLVVVWTGSYRRVERVAILLGLFEFAFFWVAHTARPQGAELISGLTHMPLDNKEYLYLVAANIGAVLMPWMIFYQQSAVADKKLRAEHYIDARWDTALGAVVTQLIMVAVLVADCRHHRQIQLRFEPPHGRRHQQGPHPVPGSRDRPLGLQHGHHWRRDGGRHRRVAGVGLGLR